MMVKQTTIAALKMTASCRQAANGLVFEQTDVGEAPL